MSKTKTIIDQQITHGGFCDRVVISLKEISNIKFKTISTTKNATLLSNHSNFAAIIEPPKKQFPFKPYSTDWLTTKKGFSSDFVEKIIKSIKQNLISLPKWYEI